MDGGTRPWHLGLAGLNPYFAFTDACNGSQPRIILASGQACVWYRLTLASKDGDWIIDESDDACAEILARLETLGARYRLGAPLHPRWLAAGWSSHFEAVDSEGMRLRFDFVSRPPRLAPSDLATLWARIRAGAPAVVDPETLIRLKLTLRLKDYPFVGALAPRLPTTTVQARWTLDPGHLRTLVAAHPEVMAGVERDRPGVAEVLRRSPDDDDAVSAAIDAEIRAWRRADEQRIAHYARAIEPWSRRFRELAVDALPLRAAHEQLVRVAAGCLPESLP